jgi:hypothetical protein
MKAISYVIIVILFLTFPACKARKAEVNPPAQVLSSFTAKYPDVKKNRWTAEDSSRYEADFQLKNKHYSALFSESGEWLLTETTILQSELPATVNRTVEDGFAAYNPGIIKQVESAKEGNYFKIKIVDRKTEKFLYLNFSGVIMRTEDVARDKD